MTPEDVILLIASSSYQVFNLVATSFIVILQAPEGTYFPQLPRQSDIAEQKYQTSGKTTKHKEAIIYIYILHLFFFGCRLVHI
jgi:hypothetical protein